LYNISKFIDDIEDVHEKNSVKSKSRALKNEECNLQNNVEKRTLHQQKNNT